MNRSTEIAHDSEVGAVVSASLIEDAECLSVGGEFVECLAATREVGFEVIEHGAS